MGEVEEGGGPGSRRIRIFVGGLGVTVMPSDLERTFSSLGNVRALEIVRTHARSFAYFDFEPSSDKALAKLFSTYNGCAWKGGRLRLEKAKEHYLARLRREWTEDAELIKSTPNDIESDMGSLEKSKCLIQEKTQLRIYFPRLKKVKSLPYSGTGRHKYSFQRVEVPSLPIHFCDCEEHCMPSETTGREHVSTLDTQIGGINDNELKIMSSVMSKLFEREASMNVSENQIASYNSDCLIEGDVPCMEYETDQLIEVDNLVTNIVMQGNNYRLGSIQAEGCGMSTYQDYAHSKLQSSNDGPTQKQPRPQRKQNSGPTNASETMSNEKSHQHPADERAKDEFPSINPKKRKKMHPEEPGSSIEAQPMQKQLKLGTDQLTNGLSWVQKSSWKDLVGETGNGTFSISHILPGFASTKQKLPKPRDAVITNSLSSRQVNSVKSVQTQSNRHGSRTLEVQKEGIVGDGVTTPNKSNVETITKEENQAGLQGGRSIPKDNLRIMDDAVIGLCKEPERKANQERRTTVAAVGSGEVCTFMRSADSEREWTKARAALNGFFKKKSDQINTSKKPTGRSNRGV